jgi:predicted outer membrane repeat protein
VNLTVHRALYVPSEYDTIQAAIDSAEDGNVVIVADGTYTGEGNRDIDFQGKAIIVRSQNGPENCIIDCQGTEIESHRGFYFQSGEASSSVVEGFTITGGYADFGGAIEITSSSPIVTDCIFVENTAYLGGALDIFLGSPTLSNCLFIQNSADYGGAISNDNLSTIVSNCILWSNSAPDGPEIYGDCAVSYSDVQGGWAGVGNIDADPCFVDALDYDFHLLPGSPAIDAGDPNSDWSNEPWPNGERINMGAYGNTSEATRSPAGFDELAVFASYWLTDEPMVDIAPEPGGDGIANFLDFAIFANFWLLEQ